MTRKATGRQSKTSIEKSSSNKQRNSLSVFHDWDLIPDPPRIGVQTDQELISKSALVNWFYRHEWKSNKPDIDLGQDLWVEIYENQRSTGMSVNIQHKSAENIDIYKLKTSPQLSYPVKIKDLLHWHKQMVPVLLVICDFRRDDERYWIFVSDIVAELEKTGRAWLQQETIQIALPLQNRLTTESLSKIRSYLADYYYPSAAKRYKDIRFGLKLSFPSTPEGRDKNAAFAKFLNTGEPVTLEKEYIADFRFSDWIERLYGRQIPSQLTFGRSSSRTAYHFRVEVYAQDGAVVPAQAIELRMLQSGRQETTLTNAHQKRPLVFTLKLMNYPDRQFIHVSFKLVHAGSTVFETRDALLFLIAATEGGRVQVIETASGKSTPAVAGEFEGGQYDSIQQFKEQAELINKLCFFQSRFRFSPVLSVRGKYLTADDYYQAHKLYTVCQTGLLSLLHQDITFTIDRRDGIKLSNNRSERESIISEEPEKGLTLELITSQDIAVLGRKIELGSVRTRVLLTIEQTRSYQEQIKNAIEKNLTEIKISIPDVAIEFTYLDWRSTDDMFGFKLRERKRN